MPTKTLIGLAIDKNPVEFADTFNQVLAQKAADAIEAKRVELAQSIYSSNDEDLNIEDLDIDDDFDDIDLDDLDLEDLPDDQND